jgi:protein ImuB
MSLFCLFVPSHPLQAVALARPELKACPEPLGIYAAGGDAELAQRLLMALNRAAAARGVRSGVRVALARALCPEITLAALEPEVAAAASDTLLQASIRLFPSVQEVAPGWIFAEGKGLERLHGDDAAIGRAWRSGLRRAGFETRVGAAQTQAAARMAALLGDGVTVVPAGQERIFLAPLPIAALEAPAELVETLQRWGLHRLGDFAALPREGVGARLGPAGVRLHRQACGEEVDRMQPLPPTEEWVERVELEWGVSQVEPLLFALRAPLERLLGQLTDRGHSCGALSLKLTLEPHGFTQLPVAMAAPTRELGVLLTLVRSALELHPALAPVVGVEARASAATARRDQLRLFGMPTVAPEQLMATVARAEALVGAGRVGAAAVRDTHLPGDDATLAVRFDPSPPPPESSPLSPATERRCALRLFRPPLAAEVLMARSGPTALHAEGVRGRVVDCAGPWPVDAKWWEPSESRAMDCYDVALSDGGIYRLAFDRIAGKWLVQGTYD